MPDYKKMYHIMFNAATDADRLTRQSSAILKKAHQECEELYVSADDSAVDFPGQTRKEAAEE